MLHPNQFQANEAWIAFTLNESPIQTEQDGSFNCVCLMDAASCFILANAMVPLKEAEPSQLEVRRLFKMAQAHKKGKPAKLFVPTGQFQISLAAEAKRQGIDVISTNERQLHIFIGEARDGFRAHVQNRPPSPPA